jgi:hypothetical protein
VSLTIDRFSTDAERDENLAALKKGGQDSLRNQLITRSQIGSVKVGDVSTALKFIYERTTAEGRQITAVTASQIAFIGAGLPGAKPTVGFEFGLVTLTLPASGSGRGELLPAAKLRLNDQGTLGADDYSGQKVVLSNVAGKE